MFGNTPSQDQVFCSMQAGLMSDVMFGKDLCQVGCSHHLLLLLILLLLQAQVQVLSTLLQLPMLVMLWARLKARGRAQPSPEKPGQAEPSRQALEGSGLGLAFTKASGPWPKPYEAPDYF